MDSDFKYKLNSIPVIYEDQWFLIVDKPAGLLTIPTPKKESRTLSSILNNQAKQKELSYRLHPCHRLDRDTSGLIIYAKGKSSQKKMMEEFKAKRIKKIYIVFAQGIIKENSGKINKPIEGRFAITGYRVLQRRQRFCVLEVAPLTGRKNQIRIHFKSIGHPLVGESRFAFRKDFPLRAKRVCLHAKSLEFRHPLTKKQLRVDSDLPQYLKIFLSKHS